jgi:hypothetical protein
MTILFGFETLKTDENNGHKNGYQAKKRLKKSGRRMQKWSSRGKTKKMRRKDNQFHVAVILLVTAANKAAK